MGLLRSEPMRHGTFVLPHDRARHLIDVLARRVNVQFVDMNATSMKRPYKKQIQRIDELERILRLLTEQIDKFEVPVEKGNIDDFLQHDSAYSLDKVEEALNQLYMYFVRFDNNNKKMLRTRSLSVEEQLVCLTATQLLTNSSSRGSASQVDVVTQSEQGMVGDGAVAAAATGGIASGVSVSILSGVLSKANQTMFSNVLFRISRGNSFCRFSPVAEKLYDENGEAYEATVFTLYFQGGVDGALGKKIKRTVEAFNGRLYNWPASVEDAWNRIAVLKASIEDNNATIDGFSSYFVNEIQTLVRPARPGGNSLLEEWRLFCLKEKALYATLNMFEGEDLALRAFGWFPAYEEELIAALLQQESAALHCSAFLLVDRNITGHVPETHGAELDASQLASIAPTFFDSSDLIKPMQMLVDTYGVPRYQEVNPALFATILYPFLFGVMYGDVGHGSVFLFLALYLFWLNRTPESAKEAKKGSFGMAIGARWLLLFMGFFAVYCGFLYNDFMSVGMDVFGGTSFEKVAGTAVWQKKKDYSPYPFGLDPAWKGSANELTFLNALKMKMSVVLGFSHMMLGIALKGVNYLYFGKTIDFIFDFIPQVVFFLSLIGYMIFLIIYKWCTATPESPMIITTVLDMVFSLGGYKGEEFYPGQGPVQKFLIAMAIISIPFMLVGKPIALLIQHKSEQASNQTHRPLVDSAVPLASAPQLTPLQYSANHHQTSGEHLLDDLDDTVDHHDDHDHLDVTNLFIHQAIESIEFILGSVSNTASYLRLWALSLAHAQLASVLFAQVMLPALDADLHYILKSFLVVGLFAAFIVLTAGIILAMDSMECVLHTLRLQWVEFQNKFYKADGFKFVPYNHRNILSSDDDEL